MIAPPRSIVLASASPRRYDLLRSLGLSFSVRPASIAETPRPGEAAGDMAERLAREKAAGIQALPEPSLVLAADTVVALGGRLLGKPRDDREARDMLSRLAGATHEVITGYALRLTPENSLHSGRALSRVGFVPMSRAEIDWYVGTGEGRDKAGAYALQGIGALFISRVEGSYTNVIGLPLDQLYPHLRRLGLIGRHDADEAPS